MSRTEIAWLSLDIRLDRHFGGAQNIEKFMLCQIRLQLTLIFIVN